MGLFIHSIETGLKWKQYFMQCKICSNILQFHQSECKTKYLLEQFCDLQKLIPWI